MKTDRFTKLILTIIAINLTFFTVKSLNLIPNAYGNEPTTNLKLIPNVKYGIVPINEDGTINVNIKSFSSSTTMDVNIAKINGYKNFYDHNYNGVHDRIPVYDGH